MLNIKSILTATFVSFIAIILPGFALAADFEFLNFESDITIHEDRSVDVTETITVEFLFDKNNRGIFREIPTVYVGENGAKFNSRLRVGDVLQNGQSAVVEVSGIDYKNIRIGDPDMYLDAGVYEYEINYTVRDTFFFYENYDEFYWNVTGNEWDVSPQNVVARITLPTGASVLQSACYTGSFGSKNQNCTVETVEGITTVTANDFLTVGIGFEKGIIEEPTGLHKTWLWFLRNWPIVPAPIILMLLMRHFIQNRTKKTRRPVIAEYEPPNNHTPAEVAWMAKKRNFRRLVAGTMIHLAVRGYFKIDLEQKPNGKIKNATFTRLKSKTDLKKYEQDIMDFLFMSDDTTVTLKTLQKRTNYALSTFVMHIKHELTPEIYDDNTELLLFPAGMTFLSFFLVIASGIAESILAFVTYFLLLFVCVIFMILTKQPTETGYEMIRRAKGFRLFMHTAERYRSQWQERQGEFEKYLPYAIAFGDTKRWSKQFPAEIKDVSWMHSNVPLSNFVFLNTVASLAASTASTAAIPSSSSSSGGSSGGGFSGGGFGGGGGGSW